MTSQVHCGIQHVSVAPQIKVNPKDLLFKDVLSKLTFSSGEVILDFGCRDGTILKRHLVPVAERISGKVIGFDISQAQINAAIKNNSHPSVEYICGDIFSAKNPLSGKKFNKIVSIFALEYDTNYLKFIQEFSKLLVPGGSLWIVTSTGEKLYNLFDRVRKDPELSPLVGISNSPDWIKNKESVAICYRKALEGVGLKVVECEEKILKYEFENMSQCAEYFTGVVPSVKELTPEMIGKLKELCRKEISEFWVDSKVADDKSPVTINYKALTVLAAM